MAQLSAALERRDQARRGLSLVEETREVLRRSGAPTGDNASDRDDNGGDRRSARDETRGGARPTGDDGERAARAGSGSRGAGEPSEDARAKNRRGGEQGGPVGASGDEHGDSQRPPGGPDPGGSAASGSAGSGSRGNAAGAQGEGATARLPQPDGSRTSPSKRLPGGATPEPHAERSSPRPTTLRDFLARAGQNAPSGTAPDGRAGERAAASDSGAPRPGQGDPAPRSAGAPAATAGDSAPRPGAGDPARGSPAERSPAPWGDEHDPNLLGAPSTLQAARQRVSVAGRGGTAGPSRAETILRSSQRGFSGLPYRRVFSDYTAVADEVMARQRVPPGYRFYVERYFRLIQPRP